MSKFIQTILHTLGLAFATTQLILLTVISLIHADPKLTHNSRMEFIVINGFIGLISAGLAIATKERPRRNLRIHIARKEEP